MKFTYQLTLLIFVFSPMAMAGNASFETAIERLFETVEASHERTLSHLEGRIPDSHFDKIEESFDTSFERLYETYERIYPNLSLFNPPTAPPVQSYEMAADAYIQNVQAEYSKPSPDDQTQFLLSLIQPNSAPPLQNNLGLVAEQSDPCQWVKDGFELLWCNCRSRCVNSTNGVEPAASACIQNSCNPFKY